jgi:branched-chain amino acid aminotransferase
MNGKIVLWNDAKIHFLTHSLHYGTAVFEGIRCYNTEKGPAIFRLQEHIKRLFDSASIVRMEIPYSFDEVCEACKEVVKRNSLEECFRDKFVQAQFRGCLMSPPPVIFGVGGGTGNYYRNTPLRKQKERWRYKLAKCNPAFRSWFTSTNMTSK